MSINRRRFLERSGTVAAGLGAGLAGAATGAGLVGAAPTVAAAAVQLDTC